MGIRRTYPIFTTRRNKGQTASASPWPNKLLTNVLAVEAQAMTAIKVKADILRMMLVAAKYCSPKCSI